MPSMPFRFIFGGPPLLEYTRSSDDPSGESQDLASQDHVLARSNNHSGNDNILSIIEESEDSIGIMTLSQESLRLPSRAFHGGTSVMNTTVQIVSVIISIESNQIVIDFLQANHNQQAIGNMSAVEDNSTVELSSSDGILSGVRSLYFIYHLLNSNCSRL